jgi:uncharacterized protein (DUF305 family)
MVQRRVSILVAAAVVAAAAGVAIAARAGSDESAAAPRPSAVTTSPQRVVLPGRPGDPATVTDTDRVRAPDGSTYNGADAAFVRMMIVHHGQAAEMARLVPDRAADPGLRALAERIGAVQPAEIEWMRSWLAARRLSADDRAHEHGAMPGMQTPAAMTTLAGLRGEAFDRTFVAMMIDHHRGAVRMAGDVLRSGTDEKLREVAGEMAVEQGGEIRRLRQLQIPA